MGCHLGLVLRRRRLAHRRNRVRRRQSGPGRRRLGARRDLSGSWPRSPRRCTGNRSTGRLPWRHDQRRPAAPAGDRLRTGAGAARLRALVGARGGARCARCGSLVLADVVDVDHVQPIALGGEGTDGNVQPLCRDCHLAKTGEDFPPAVARLPRCQPRGET
ncbi:HNH endonuclease signature motif containing protein [Streptomyces sp. NPDC005423]|uniref:HNH endonuclease n=1 Tax=Streptomyces sp. NPDC005423 TaxID=3155343 RepID=UPI0033B5B967